MNARYTNIIQVSFRAAIPPIPIFNLQHQLVFIKRLALPSINHQPSASYNRRRATLSQITNHNSFAFASGATSAYSSVHADCESNFINRMHVCMNNSHSINYIIAPHYYTKTKTWIVALFALFACF